MTDFTSRWTFASTPVVGVEIPQTPVNPDVGSYGYRSVGVPSITCAVGAKGALTLDAVDGDANRANAEVLTIVQLSSATPNYSAGCLVRGSGALAAENGYSAYVDEATGAVRIIKVVGGTITDLTPTHSALTTSTYGTSTTDELTFTHTNTGLVGGNNYTYWKIRGSGYTIASGDVLRFDVWVDPNNPEDNGLTGAGAVEIDVTTTPFNGRSSGIADSTDGRSLIFTPAASRGQWVSRAYSLTPLAAKVISAISLVNENERAGTYVCKYRNMRITDASGSTVQMVVWRGGLVEFNEDNYSLGFAGQTVTIPAKKTLAATAQDWYLRFRANGTMLSAKVWRYGVVEPTTWDVTVTDSSVTGVGWAGLFSRCLVANNLSLSYPGFVSVATNGETAPIPISEAQFRQWANDDSNQRVVLCEMGVLGQTSGGAANESLALFSNHPYTTRGSEIPRNQVYDDVLLEVPTFTSKVSDDLTGRPSQGYGDLVIKNESGARDEWLTWNCDGRPLTMFVGGVGWRKWDFYRVLTGYVYETYAPAKDRIGFKIRDRSVLLNRKLQTAVIGGTSANAGAPRPITFGKVFNAEAQLKDSATLRYTIHDESLAGATGFTQVRDSGVSVTYTADLANGEFTLSAAPAGRITVDVTVNQSAGSSSRAGITHQSALATIVADRFGFGAAGVYSGQRIGSLSAFGASPTAQIGLYVSAEANVMDVLDDIASSAGGFWYFNRLGLFCAALVRVPAAPFDHVVGLDDMQYDSFRIERLYIPSAVEQLGFQRNWTIQKDGVAGSVTAANRALYAAPAQYTQVVPVYSGLDQPSNHLLQRLPRNRDTLFVNQADAAAEAARLDGIFSKPCAIVSFVTKTNAFFYNLGESVQVTADRFGLTEEAGKAGIIVGLDEDFANGSVRVQVFIQLAGVFPVTDTAEPYVTAGDFY